MQLVKRIIKKTVDLRKAENSNSHCMESDSRRTPIDRREYSYTKHLPERRDTNRRKGKENRRKGKDRRSGDDRRNGSIISEEK